MSYDEDPTRWTSSPDDAPELLRGAFSAGRDEGPSRTQMRSLALKIAAASAGGAVAVGTVKAASAGHAVTTAATWSVGKVATVIALAGTLVTGGAVLWQAGSQPSELGTGTSVPGAGAPAAGSPPEAPITAAGAGSASSPSSAARETPAPTVEPLASARGAREADEGSARARGAADGSGSLARGSARVSGAQPANAVSTRAVNTRVVGARKGEKASGSASVARKAEAKSLISPTAQRVNEKADQPQSEIELLRRAQVALQARPREAFQLTQEHRRLYPSGEFAQERDALAIQALMRAGESEKARDLAESFIRAYPSSPHAHRFREAMGIR